MYTGQHSDEFKYMKPLMTACTDVRDMLLLAVLVASELPLVLRCL
jgi:hypothetical protein